MEQTQKNCSTNCDCEKAVEPSSISVQISQVAPGCSCNAPNLIAAIENLTERDRSVRESRLQLMLAETRVIDATRDVARQLELTVGLGRWVIWGDVMFCAVKMLDGRLILKTQTVD